MRLPAFKALAPLLPRPSLRRVARQNSPPLSRTFVFARLPNPTFDYFFASRMTADGPPCVLCDIRRPMPPDADAFGARVVICRYLSRDALDWIERNDEDLADVAFFTDDDVSTFVLSHEAKPGYRLFLYKLALAPLPRLGRVLDRLYVSTPALAERFAPCRPTILPPAPTESFFRPAGTRPDRDRLRIVFHAKAIHDGEHAFLAPILRDVVSQRPAIAIEVSGEERALGAWQQAGNVTFVPEIPWPAYVERTRREGADIVLVPLLPSAANALRSDTKRIDVARMGAAGVFSLGAVYGEPDGSGEFIVPNDHAAWVEAIVRLIDSPSLRTQAAAATRHKVEAMAERGKRGFPA